MKDIYQVIKNVRLSEKATMLQETNNEVVLEVDRKANKLEIKRAVETATIASSSIMRKRYCI